VTRRQLGSSLSLLSDEMYQSNIDVSKHFCYCPAGAGLYYFFDQLYQVYYYYYYYYYTQMTFSLSGVMVMGLVSQY
jgi:hypothetical protein